MLKRRLIPKLQLKTSRFGGGNRLVLVTTVRFGETVEVGDPVSQAKIYEAQAADELVFVDLEADRHDRAAFLDVIRAAAAEIFMPITVGGGVRTLEDFRVLLANGADKVSVNTAAFETPDLINGASARYGAQCVVLSIDHRRGAAGRDEVWIRNGTVNTGRSPLEWALEGQERGAGEILLTSIDRDGTRQGLDLELTRAVSSRLSIPVITSGGCGLASHFSQGFLEGGADAVAAGTYFCFKDENPMQARSQIKNSGIPIRLLT